MAESVAAAREATGQDSACDATKLVFTAECYIESIDITLSFYELSIALCACQMLIIPVATCWSRLTAGSPWSAATLHAYTSLSSFISENTQSRRKRSET